MILPKLIADEHTAMENLMDILMQEHEGLTQFDNKSIDWTALSERKQALCDEIALLDRKRLAAIAEAGYPHGAAGSLEAARHGGLLKEWDDLQELTGRVGNLNKINGDLLKQRMEHNSRVLDTLNDLVGKRLYSPSGQSRRESGRLNITA